MEESGADAAGVPLEPEDAERAGLYGLIGRLFYGPPDPNLMAEIARAPADAPAPGEGGKLLPVWRELQTAARNAFPAVVRQEYDNLFVGVGKAPVSPYLSAYARASSPDRYLVELRQKLAEWGLARRSTAGEVEDHVAGVCDVMRWLIVNGQPIAVQSEFYGSFIRDHATALFAAVQNSTQALFYKQVAALGAAFFSIERAAFEVAESE